MSDKRYPPPIQPSEPATGVFKSTFFLTAGIFVGLSLLSTVGAVFPPLFVAWFVAALAWPVTLIAATGLTIAGERSRGAGLFAGLGIGILALATSCFANLAVFPT